ncbi:NAD+ transporter 1 [Planoprotostelium fungivorum]|uniref:NAD+ transporter 1 n=1 Tax=Planoprotostelium fungivorum TaxID=1890364 RepID=A0A2P6MYS0_9EUKA|nr:hypothetical protein PROFUN_13204 [Planoprotostelium fungivorum]PRP76865.1 NAD+ transporter 1 [Planoprotostelium fungivorum]
MTIAHPASGKDHPVAQEHKHRTLGPIANGLAGSGAGAIAAFFTCPLDVVKTVLQVQKARRGDKDYSGIWGDQEASAYTGKRIFRTEGVRGSYKGLGTTLLALIPNWGVYFYSYSFAKDYAKSAGYKEGAFVYLASSVFAASITDVVTTPLWMIKTRMQMQSTGAGRKYKNTFHAIQVISREEGVLALWRGLIPQLIGILHVAVQFPLYELSKSWVANRGNKSRDNLNSYELILTSAVSKCAASAVAYPHEVLRSRFQYQKASDPGHYTSISHAVSTILKEEGVLGFYRGMGANLMRTVPACAITFTSYELLARNINAKLNAV